MPSFSTLIKPASSLCNMRCRYCFYCDEAENREIASYGIMSRETARSIIDRAFEYSGGRGNVSFAFQGGEPTLAGLPFFEDFVAYADEIKPEKVTLNYSIQTNGILIDEKWCDLFVRNRFLVGISVDGPENINDRCRIYPSGEGTFAKVADSIKLMKRLGVDFNILSVITKQSAAHPTQLWNYYKKNGFGFVQLIPCLAPLDNSGKSFDHALSPAEYSSFLITFFRLWADEFEKGNYVSVRLFDNLVNMATGNMPEMCGMTGSCSAQCVIEADGGVYPCDFYVLDRYLAGNINESSFADILGSDTVRSFLSESMKKPEACPNCRFYQICRGGCRRYRDFYMSGKSCPYAGFLESSYRRINGIARALMRNSGKQ